MEESDDNVSSEDLRCDDGSSVKAKPRKRSLVERELETNLTARVTSPVTSSDSSSTSRYGRARRLKTDSEFLDTEKATKPKSPIPKVDKSPSKIQSPVYKMHASISPVRIETPKRLEHSLENQIENIYTENMSLSRFGSEEKKNKSSTKKYPKVYIRKDLLQTKDKDSDDTVVLIKNMFSPSNSSKKSNLSYSSEKHSSNIKKPNGHINSVVKTLDFDGNKKKKVVERKSLSKSELFEMEAKCEYQVGDLAWARMGTYPFWPCIITRDPLSEMFVKKKLFGRVERDVLHVTFFGDNGRRGWIVDSMLRRFLGQLEFEVARTNFTPEAKKKDPKLYAAFFVSEKKMPSWQISVEEAETLLREPKRLRIDILNDMLEKSRQNRTTPKLERSKKVTRTNSDVSLSESLYDTLFSEDDSKGNDFERSRSKSRNRSLNVSEVVTACLDNMAAKTGITKIQRQSHMDRWLQKAKSKTPEKSHLKSHKISNSSKTKKNTHEERKELYRQSSLESQCENKLQSHQNEHDYSQKYCDNGRSIVLDDVEIEYKNSELLTDSVEPSPGLDVISKVELCDKDLLDKNEDNVILTVVDDVDIFLPEANGSKFYDQTNVQSNNTNESTIEKMLEDPNSTEVSTDLNMIESCMDNAESMEVDNATTEEEVVGNLYENDDTIKENQENVDVPSNDCNQSSSNVFNTDDVDESMEVSEPKDIESNNMNEMLNNDLIINTFCVPSSDNKPNDAHTIEDSNIHITNLQIDGKNEKDKNQSENNNRMESFRRKSKRLSGKNTKVEGTTENVSEIPKENLKTAINISLEIDNNITDKKIIVCCGNKDGVNDKECDNEITSYNAEEALENELIESKPKNQENNIEIINDGVLDENVVLNNDKENTEVIESISPKMSPKRLTKFKLSLNNSAENVNTSLPITIDAPKKTFEDCDLVENSTKNEDFVQNSDNEDCKIIENNINSIDSVSNSAPVAIDDKIVQNGFMEHDNHNLETNNIENQNHSSIEPKTDIFEKEISKINNEINEQNTENKMETNDNCDDVIQPRLVDSKSVILNGYNEIDKTVDEGLMQNNVEKCQTGLVNENIPNTDIFNADTNSIHDDEDDFELRLSTSPISTTNSDNISEKKVEDVSEKNESEKVEIDPDSISIKSEDSQISIGRKKRIKDKQGKSKTLEEPEFLKYLELRQDAVMDEHPELSQEDITNYLYKTWLYEENLKTDTKKADDIDHANLVKGLNQDTAPVKKIRKKIKVDKEKYKEQTLGAAENIQKEKSKRKIIRPFYKEDFSDSEETVEYYEMFKIKQKPKSNENSIESNKIESVHNEIETTDVPIEYEEEMGQDETDLVEEYFRQLTAPKPNLFKGLIREKVCEICERIGNLVKCKGCHSMFHVDCDKKQDEIVEISAPLRGRKKKKKPRGRKAKEDANGLDSESHSDEKSQEANVSEEIQNTSIDEEESHIVANADEFEAQLSEKMKELIENPDNLDYDSHSNDELDWNDISVGECKIVDIKPRTKYPETNSNFSDFKCSNCQKHDIPICFVCKSNISPKDKAEYRQRCQVAHCQKYYHLECLDHWPQTQFNWGEVSKTNKKNEHSESLSCPRHVCHTCVCDDPRGCKTRFSGDKLAKCVRCPATYHTFTKCLPAGTQILTGSHIICPRHYEHRPGKVPCHVNTGWCFICALGGSLICCEYCPTSFHAECLNIKPPEGGYMCEDCETGRLPLYGEMVWVKLGHYRWWPGIILHPSEIPQNILAVKHSPGEFVVRFFGQYDHYWVNRGRVFPFQEGDSGKVSGQKSKIDAAFTMAMEHAQRACEILKTASSNDEESIDIASSLLPPHYVKLKVNKPCGSLCGKKIDLEESSLTQCECDPNDIDPCGPYTQCLNRMLLTECGPTCRAGDRCNNRAFEKRLYPKMVPYRTLHRGWGLKTLVDIKAGQFVIEYVGELLDEAEFRRRMRRKHDVRDENFYFLTLDKERMIDAGPKGNLARFMNHSCEPNCETQKWTVLGDIRVGLFAIYDIPANSELTFNYNLESAGIEKKRCMCGAKRCSGYIGAKPKQDDQPKKIKLPTKRTYKKRKTIEDSPSTSRNKPKNRVGRPNKPRELTEIEKDLLIIKSATNGISSDSECSVRLCSIDSSKDYKALKRKLNISEEPSSPSTKRHKSEKSVEDKLTI